jgi:type IV pilus assembly protein PilV
MNALLQSRRFAAPQSGFSLIEVLVSLVLLSVALLGTAKLTSASLKSTNTSYYRSQATMLADDIMDRMRANIAEARDQQYEVDFGPVIAAASGTVANYDCTEWTDLVAATLPAGRSTVDVDPNGVATIVIEWDNGDNSFTTTSRL